MSHLNTAFGIGMAVSAILGVLTFGAALFGNFPLDSTWEVVLTKMSGFLAAIFVLCLCCAALV